MFVFSQVFKRLDVSLAKLVIFYDMATINAIKCKKTRTKLHISLAFVKYKY